MRVQQCQQQPTQMQAAQQCQQQSIQTQAVQQCQQQQSPQLQSELDQLTLEIRQLELQITIEQKKKELMSLRGGNATTAPAGTVNKLNLNALAAMCVNFGELPDQNMFAWLQDLEKTLEILGYEVSEKLIAARYLLTGAAKRLIEIKRVYDYQQLTEVLREEYGSNSSIMAVHQQLNRRKIRKGETRSHCMIEMQHIAAFGQVSEAELVDIIINGLQYDGTDAVILYSTVKTLEELKTAVARMEKGRNEAMGIPQFQIVMASSSQQKAESEVRCYNCFKYGHYQSKCDVPERPFNSCYICAKVGNIRQECPLRREKRMTVAPVIDDRQTESSERIDAYNNVSISFCNIEGLYIKKIVSALFDTGSPVSFIRESIVWRAQVVNSGQQRYTFRGIGNKKLAIIGKVELKIQFRGKTCRGNFYVLPDPLKKGANDQEKKATEFSVAE